MVITPKEGNRLSCRLCGELFIPKREWQKFCCTVHQKQYWKQVNPFYLKKEIQELKDKVEKMEKGR